MAREIIDFGRYTAPDGTYPYGQIKDDTGSNDGTPVNVLTNGDIQQFFQRLLQTSGITVNNLPDNLDNGFQLFESLLIDINAHTGELIKYLFGGGYQVNTVYVLDGSASRSANGIVLYNYGIYYLVGNSGTACGGGLVDVIAIPDPSEVIYGLNVLKVQCGASGSALSDFADRVFINIDVTVPTTDLSTGWEGTPVTDLELKYNIRPDGYVEWSGMVVCDNASAGRTVIPAGVLPANACPPAGTYRMIPASYRDGTVLQNIFATIKFEDNGKVSICSGAGAYNVDEQYIFDGIRYRNY
jgi:hypothetical protein